MTPADLVASRNHDGSIAMLTKESATAARPATARVCAAILVPLPLHHDVSSTSIWGWTGAGEDGGRGRRIQKDDGPDTVIRKLPQSPWGLEDSDPVRRRLQAPEGGERSRILQSGSQSHRADGRTSEREGSRTWCSKRAAPAASRLGRGIPAAQCNQACVSRLGQGSARGPHPLLCRASLGSPFSCREERHKSELLGRAGQQHKIPPSPLDAAGISGLVRLHTGTLAFLRPQQSRAHRSRA